MKYTIKTPYPCVIKTKDDFVWLEPNDNLDCENEDFLYVYPQNHTILPFLVDLAHKQDCEFYSFLNHSGQNLVVFEDSSLICLEQKEMLNFAGKNCVIYIGKHHIYFESESKRISCRSCHISKDYQVFKLKNFACVLFQNDFYAFNIKQEKLFHFSGESLSFENDVLSVTKKIHDLNNREKTFQVKFGDGISIENSVCSSDKTKFGDLVCLNFLESIKAEDFASATNLLSDNLKEKIGAEQLEVFFGKITNILPLNTKEFLLVCKNSKNYVCFSVENGKIFDISLDNL